MSPLASAYERGVAFVGTRSPAGKTLLALGTYVTWTVLTWLLEGRVRTLLRPAAVIDRLVYIGLANVAFGTVLALLLVRAFVVSGFTTRAALGFRAGPRTGFGIVGGGILGVGLYLLARPPTIDPVVVTNVFAQTLPVSIAELVVCWIVVGGSVAALLRDRGVNRYIERGTALVVSAVLFGVYHFAHSPPFDSVEMVGLLVVVGLATGLIYFLGGSVYGALAFHNFAAVTGVVTSLATAGRLAAYEQPRVLLLATALVAATVLVAVERRIR